MIKFALLLTVWTQDAPHVSVMDYGMSGDDCIASMVLQYSYDPDGTQGTVSCEIDDGQPWHELPTAGAYAPTWP